MTAGSFQPFLSLMPNMPSVRRVKWHSSTEMMWIMSVVLVVLIAAPLSHSDPLPDCALNISISVDGHNGPECLDGTIPCRTLDYAFSKCTIKNSTTFTIGPGSFTLSTNLGSIYNTSFAHINDMTIAGVGPSESIINCNSSITGNSRGFGFAFVNMTNVKISNLSFVRCGEMRPSTSIAKPLDTSYAQFFVAVYIWRCTNVTMDHIHINDTEGIGLVMYETGGRVSVSHSVFYNNAIPLHARSDPQLANGGGGVNVEFPYCPPGHFDSSCDPKILNISEYHFNHCVFLNNTAYGYYQKESSKISQTVNDHQSFGRGGGLSIFFSGFTADVDVNIENSTFEGNEAAYGGGLNVDFIDGPYSSVVTISNNSYFIQNSCSQLSKDLLFGGGGGVRVAVISLDGSVAAADQINLCDTHFVQNKAYLGGGLLSNYVSVIQLIDSTWEGNTAHLGSAVCLHTDVQQVVGAFIQGCCFKDQSIEYEPQLNTHTEGYGTVYVFNTNVLWVGKNQFLNNVGSGLVVVGGVMTFDEHSTIVFDSNVAANGGGIAIYANGILEPGAYSSVHFINNSATAGGGIYVQSSGGWEQECFVQLQSDASPSTWSYNNINIYFCDNSAVVGGSDIYLSSVVPCLWYDDTEKNLSNPRFVFKPPYWSAFEYCNNNQSDNSISTGTTRFVPPGNQTQVDISAIPGQFYNLLNYFTPEDDMDVDVSSAFSVRPSINNVDASVMVLPGSTYTSGPVRFSKKSGSASSKDVMEVRTLTEPIVIIRVNVSLLECPPGSHFSDDSECMCSSTGQKGYLPGLDCSGGGDVNITVALRPDYWFGYINYPNDNHHPASGPCPSKYCSGFSSINISDLYVHNKSFCPPGSSGVLCGNCSCGVHVLSETLHCCSQGECGSLSTVGAWFLWVSIELGFTTLIVGFILIFDVRILSGELCSFVFFCQILHSLNLLYCTDCYHWPDVLSVFKTLYGLWNLRFFSGLPVNICIKDWNAIELLALEYIFAFYPFLLILLIGLVFYFQEQGWCCSCGHRLFISANRGLYKFRRFLASRTSLIHGIATCLVLTYGKLAYISLSILTPITLSVPDSSNHTITPLLSLHRAYYHGDWVYFGDQYHVYFGLLAIAVVIVFVILPPLFLMSYPVLPRVVSKCSNKVGTRLNNLYRRRTVFYLLDIFQAHYHKELLFFAGVWFVYRLVLYINDAFNPDVSSTLTIQVLCGVVFHLFHSILQPYKRRLYNIIDSLFFVNIIAISTVLLYSQSTVIPKEILEAILYILLSLPYLYFLVFIGYKVVRQVFTWCGVCRGGDGEQARLNREEGNREDYESIQGSHGDGENEWVREELIYDDYDDDIESQMETSGQKTGSLDVRDEVIEMSLTAKSTN